MAMAIEDFLQLKQDHPQLPLEQIVRIVGQKYGRNVDMEMLSGKPIDQIAKELMAVKPKAGLLTPVERGLQKGLIQTYGALASIPEFFGIPVGMGASQKALQRMAEYAPQEGPIARTVEEATAMAVPSLAIPLGAAKLAPAGKALQYATWLGPLPFATQSFLTSKRQIEQTLERTGKEVGNLPLLTGLVNGMIEYFGMALGTKYLGKLFGLDEERLLSRAARLRAIPRVMGKETAATAGRIGGETIATEIAKQVAGGKKVDLETAAGKALEHAASVVPPTLLMTAISGGLAALTKYAPGEPAPAREEVPPSPVAVPPTVEPPTTVGKGAIPIPEERVPPEVAGWGAPEVPPEGPPGGWWVPQEEAMQLSELQPQLDLIRAGREEEALQVLRRLVPEAPPKEGAPLWEYWPDRWAKEEAARREPPLPEWMGIPIPPEGVTAPKEISPKVEVSPEKAALPVEEKAKILVEQGWPERDIKRAGPETINEIFDKGLKRSQVSILRSGGLKILRPEIPEEGLMAPPEQLKKEPPPGFVVNDTGSGVNVHQGGEGPVLEVGRDFVEKSPVQRAEESIGAVANTLVDSLTDEERATIDENAETLWGGRDDEGKLVRAPGKARTAEDALANTYRMLFTDDEKLKDFYPEARRYVAELAVERNLPVPDHVLEEYPDLKEKVSPQSQDVAREVQKATDIVSGVGKDIGRYQKLRATYQNYLDTLDAKLTEEQANLQSPDAVVRENARLRVGELLKRATQAEDALRDVEGKISKLGEAKEKGAVRPEFVFLAVPRREMLSVMDKFEAIRTEELNRARKESRGASKETIQKKATQVALSRVSGRYGNLVVRPDGSLYISRTAGGREIESPVIDKYNRPVTLDKAMLMKGKLSLPGEITPADLVSALESRRVLPSSFHALKDITEATNNTYKAQLDELRAKRDAYKQQINDILRGASEEEISAVKEDIGSEEAKLRMAKEKLKGKKKVSRREQAEVNRLEKRVRELKDTLKNAKKKRSLKDLPVKERSRVVAYKATMHDISSKIKALDTERGAFADLQSRLRKIEGDLSEFKTMKLSSISSLERYPELIKSYRKILNSFEYYLSDLAKARDPKTKEAADTVMLPLKETIMAIHDNLETIKTMATDIPTTVDRLAEYRYGDGNTLTLNVFDPTSEEGYSLAVKDDHAIVQRNGTRDVHLFNRDARFVPALADAVTFNGMSDILDAALHSAKELRVIDRVDDTPLFEYMDKVLGDPSFAKHTSLETFLRENYSLTELAEKAMNEVKLGDILDALESTEDERSLRRRESLKNEYGEDIYKEMIAKMRDMASKDYTVADLDRYLEGLYKSFTKKIDGLAKAAMSGKLETPAVEDVIRSFKLSPHFADLLTGRFYDAVQKAFEEPPGRAYHAERGSRIAKKVTGAEFEPGKEPKARKRPPTNVDLELSMRKPNRIIQNLHALADWKELGLPRPVSIVDMVKDPVEKIFQRYADTVLGGLGVKMELINPERFVGKLKELGVSEEALVRAVKAHGFTDEQIATFGLPELVKRAFLGATVDADNLSSLVYINDHLSDVGKVRAGIHELVEVLYKAGKLDEKDFRVIKREFGEDWKERFADSVADYILSEDSLSPRRQTLLGKAYSWLKTVVLRIRNALHGDGFRSAKDIAESIRRGDYASRKEDLTVVPPQSESDFTSQIALSLADDPAIEVDLGRGRPELDDIWKMIREGIKAIGGQVAGLYEDYIMNPQWSTDPFRKRIFGMIEGANEMTKRFVYDTLNDLHPKLKDLKKRQPILFGRLENAIIASDKAGTMLSDEQLKRHFSLSDEAIGHYKAIKEKFDYAIDQTLRAYQASIMYAYTLRLDPGARSIITNTIEEMGLQAARDLAELPKEELARQYGLSDDDANALAATLEDVKKPLAELDKQLETYKKGFYFPRIRPGGKFGVLLYVPEGKGFYEFGRWQTHPAVLRGREAAELELLLGRLKKRYSNSIEFKRPAQGNEEEARKAIAGKDLVIFRNQDDYLAYKHLLGEDQHAAVTTQIERMPGSFFENVSSSAVLEALDYAINKMKAEKIEGDMAQEFADKLSRVIQEELSDMMKERSTARSRFIRRRGRETGGINIDLDLSKALQEAKAVEGYNTSILDVLPQYMATMGQHISRVLTSSRLNDYTSTPDIKEMLSTKPDQYKWYRNYTKGVMASGGPMSVLAQRAKSIATLWFLGLRVSSAAIQITQMLSTGAPELAPFVDADADAIRSYEGRARPLTEVGAHVERQAKSVKMNAKAFKDVLSSSMTVEEKAALDEGIRRGSTLAQFTADMMSEVHRLLGSLTPLANAALKPFQWAEAKSREAGFLAGYRLAREKGLGHNEAIEFADKYTKMAYHVYEKSNRPVMALREDGLGALTNVLTSLRGYEMNYMGWIYNALKGEGGKVYADKVVSSFLYTAMLGGLFAIPGADQLLRWIERATGKPLHNDILKSFPKGPTREAMEFGILSPLFHTDLSGSLRLGIIPEELSLSGLADTLFGVWRGSYNKFTRAQEYATTDQWRAMMEALSPLGIERASQAMRWMAGEPVRTVAGKRLTDLWGRPVQPSMLEDVMAIMGFRPASISRAWMKRGAAKTVQNYWYRQRRKIYGKVRYATTWADLMKLIPEMNKYNQRVAKYGGAIPPITASSIRQQLKEREGRPEKLAPFLE